MSKGTANWKLDYPPERTYGLRHEWKACGSNRQAVSSWAKFIRLCRMLKRTRAEYQVTYLDMGTHCRAFVTWWTQ